MGLSLPGEILEEEDSICFQDQLCLQVISPTLCLDVNPNFPDGVICVENLQSSLCWAATPGNAGVVRQDVARQDEVRQNKVRQDEVGQDEEIQYEVRQQNRDEKWILGGVMTNEGLSNCEAGFPFWITSAEYFIDWIKDLMDEI